jgi:(E)-4-hydroxy-3-methylbut-2-enyl-diphosphate synthase
MIQPGPSATSHSHTLPYMNNRLAPVRRQTIEVQVGNRIIGGQAPILVQSMTTTLTQDIDATVFQTLEMAKAGCELVRITAPTQKDAECLREIVAKVRKAGCQVPISADIHFQPRAAMEALKWVEKVRINPGNFVDVKLPTPRPYDDAGFAAGAQKVYDVFAPFVKEAKERGVALRIGTNHGSLSDRMMWKFGDSVEGMVESALEYLRVCEDVGFDQIVFSMKASNPRVAVQAYRLLAARLDQGHKAYPFHVGVTEAGDGEDGRLKSAVGIGSLLLDGLGDTVRVSLTEDPVHEIPVAQQLIQVCPARGTANAPRISEALDFYNYARRSTEMRSLGNVNVGLREPVAIGIPHPAAETLPVGERRVEWLRAEHDQGLLANVAMGSIGISVREGTHWRVVTDSEWIASAKSKASNTDHPTITEIQITDFSTLDEVLRSVEKSSDSFLWSIPYGDDIVSRVRHLTAKLHHAGRTDILILNGITDQTPQGNMAVAARLGSLLVDGIGDMISIASPAGSRAAMNLAYDILQAAGVRKSKPEYVSCPSCGRTLFDLQSTTQNIRAHTAHLRNISIAIMGCIVNGPGEMADADFGYVGGAPGKVNLYVGRNCVKKNIPEADAPQALIGLIKEHGRWVEPSPVTSVA